MTDDAATTSQKPDSPLSVLGLSVIGATLAADQATKAWAESTLIYGQQIDLLPILSLYRVHNTGIAFSLLSGFGTLSLVVLILAVTAVVLLIWWRTSDGGRLAAVGYALIVGGALGNLVDRLAYGHVVDFLYLHLGERPLFVFNLADAALTLGPAIMILIFLLPRSRSPDDAT
jgi:signal peptidase II